MLKKILLLSVATFISAQASSFTPSGDPATDLMMEASSHMMKLSNFVSNAQVQLAKEKAEVSLLQDEVSRTKSGAALLNKQILDLTNQLSAAHSTGSTATTALQLDLDKAKHNLGLAQKDIHDKTAEISILQKDLFDLTGEVSTAKSQLASMERDRDDWQRKHGAVEGDLLAAKRDLSTATHGLSVASSKVSHLESEVLRLEKAEIAALATGSSTATGLSLDLAKVKKDLSDAQNEVSARQRDIDLLKDQVRDLGDEVARHKVDIATHLSTISTVTGERDDWQREHGIVGGKLKASEADLLLERNNLSKATGDLKLANDDILRLDLELKAAQAGSATASQLQIDITDAKKARAAAERDIKKHEATIISLQASLTDLTDDKYVQSAVRNRGKLTRTYSEQNLDIQALDSKHKTLDAQHQDLTSRLEVAQADVNKRLYGGEGEMMDPDHLIRTLTNDAIEKKEIDEAARRAMDELGMESHGEGNDTIALIQDLAHKHKGLDAAMGRAKSQLHKQEQWWSATPATMINDLLEMLQQQSMAFSQQHHGEQELTEHDWNEEDSHMERQGLGDGAVREKEMPKQDVRKEAPRMMSTTDKF